MIDLSTIRNTDPEVCKAMEQELARQRGNLELIASENIVSPAVMAAMGSHLTNKYAEGYPGKRYYGGCAFVDIVENLARDRLKEIFGCEHANVQPHSGAQANFAVYFAMLKPGDTVSIDAGPLEGFTGKIVETNDATQKARVNIEMFGRSTDVEVEYMQMKKVDVVLPAEEPDPAETPSEPSANE